MKYIELIVCFDYENDTLFSHRLTPGGTEILVGTNDLTKGGRYYKVDKFVVHEDYEYPKHANDIAVIHVLESIEFNDKVQPIELETEEVSEGTELQFTGWGQLGVIYTLKYLF